MTTLCPDCEEYVEDSATYHPGCCPHEEVDLDLGFAGDPARETPDHGICTSCGAEVHLEHDEDRVYWEAD